MPGGQANRLQPRTVPAGWEQARALGATREAKSHFDRALELIRQMTVSVAGGLYWRAMMR